MCCSRCRLFKKKEKIKKKKKEKRKKKKKEKRKKKKEKVSTLYVKIHEKG
jgi:hypothetical protein